MLFAAEALGYNVKLYDGSFQDWSKRQPADRELPQGQMSEGDA